MEIVTCQTGDCGQPLTTRWTFCPYCGRRIVALKLRSNGDAARDHLVEARINLRRVEVRVQ